MSVLIWVQTVRKGYQQTTKVIANKKRVNIMGESSKFPKHAYKTFISSLNGIGLEKNRKENQRSYHNLPN